MLCFFVSRPDINAIRALPMVPATVKTTPAAVSRVSIEDRDLARQGSLVDGEGIKIVIHDVDSEVGQYFEKMELNSLSNFF